MQGKPRETGKTRTFDKLNNKTKPPFPVPEGKPGPGMTEVDRLKSQWFNRDYGITEKML